MKRLLLLVALIASMALGIDYGYQVLDHGFKGDTLPNHEFTTFDDVMDSIGPTAWDTFKLTAGIFTTVTWIAPDTATVNVDTANLRIWVGTVVPAAETLTAGWGITTAGERVGDDTVEVNRTDLDTAYARDRKSVV